MYDRKERCQYKCQNVLAFLRIARSATITHFKVWQLRSRIPVSEKFDLTTIFANVTPQAFDDRIVSVLWRGSSLEGGIQLILFVFSGLFRVDFVGESARERALLGQSVEGADH